MIKKSYRAPDFYVSEFLKTVIMNNSSTDIKMDLDVDLSEDY